MIIFELQCPQGHRFEGWFASGNAFESQRESGLLECPVCGEGNIRKAPTAFAIGSPRLKSSGNPGRPEGPAPGLPVTPVRGEEPDALPPDFPAAEFRKDPMGVIREMERNMARFVRDNFEDVGVHFAKEALKMHYGAEEHRNIRGVSSPEEERLLTDEGIRFMKLPVAPPSVKEDGGPVHHEDADKIDMKTAPGERPDGNGDKDSGPAPRSRPNPPEKKS
ncbi:MAG: hypothetical protein CSB33_04955 [Desulfobacterales bacterium]|nr:MAG: hypothetical protein CSB33_04955 [Desulfobacterales bacterium]